MPDPGRTSPALLAVLAAAIALGAAASLLAAAAPVFQPTSSGVLGSWSPSQIQLGLVLLTPLLLIIVATLWRRVREATSPLPAQFLVSLLMVGVLAVAFVALTLLFSGSPHGLGLFGQQNGTTPPNVTTNNSSGSPPVSGTNPALPGTPWGVPSWLPIAVFVIAALALVGFAAPALSRRWARGGLDPGGEGGARATAQRAFAEAAARLETSSDPRSIIVDLYVVLLGQVARVSGDLDARTPEEIREESLIPLGIRREVAEQLTRLFEEARYSSHPMGPEDVRRAQAALRAAESDLGRRGVAG
jgi:hypothetical protein